MANLRVLKLVDKTRTLVMELPEDIPLGLAEVVITMNPLENGPGEPADSPMTEREITRAKLRAAGLLVEVPEPPASAARIEDADLPILGRLPPGARTTEELLDEDRGER